MPELSVVVPVLNEARTLGPLLEMLNRQEDIALQVIVVDGGSSDGTRNVCVSAPFPVTMIFSDRGRGRQLNAGAAAADGDYLLFLHADSRLPDPQALRSGVDMLRDEQERTDSSLAGRYRLRFDGVSETHTGFRFHEAKARLGRRGCIHGDQGFLLQRAFFHDLGGFREDLPVLEDTLLAERIRERGRWILLPAEIRTSPRRFLAEGVARRDTLNAVIVNLGVTGWMAPLREMPALYRTQCDAARLDPLPFFLMFQKMLEELPEEQRREVWERTAGFVRDNAWQIPLALDTLGHLFFRRTEEMATAPALRFFDRHISSSLDGTAGLIAAKLLVRGWFFCSILIWKCFDRLRR